MDVPEGSKVDGHSIKPVKTKFIVKIVDFLIKETLKIVLTQMRRHHMM